MNADARADAWFNLGVAIWWTAQFRLYRATRGFRPPDPLGEMMRRRFMAQYRLVRHTANGLAIPGVTS